MARVDSSTSPIDHLGSSMLIAGMAIPPLEFFDAALALANPTALLSGSGIGLSSSVLPYGYH